MTSVTKRTGSRLMTLTLLALVLLAGLARSGAEAAIAFVQNLGSDGNTVPGTSISLNLHGNVTVAAGDTVIVTFVMDPSAVAVSCADGGGNSYSNLPRCNGARLCLVRHRRVSSSAQSPVKGPRVAVRHPVRSPSADPTSLAVFARVASGLFWQSRRYYHS